MTATIYQYKLMKAYNEKFISISPHDIALYALSYQAYQAASLLKSTVYQREMVARNGPWRLHAQASVQAYYLML